MHLCFDPIACPEATLPEALKIAKAAGFDAMVLHCAMTASSPYHPDASVRMIRDYFDRAGVALLGLQVRDLTGLNAKGEVDPEFNLRQVEWDIHLARALRLRCANFLGGPRTLGADHNSGNRSSRTALLDGVHALLARIPDVTLNLGNAEHTWLERAADFDALIPDLPARAFLWLNAPHIDDARRVIDNHADRIGNVTLTTPDPDIIHALQANGYNGPVAVKRRA